MLANTFKHFVIIYHAKNIITHPLPNTRSLEPAVKKQSVPIKYGSSAKRTTNALVTYAPVSISSQSSKLNG
jgi:hypothetical protein